MYGCETVVCYDAETAFATTLRFKPDVCLIDLNMPNTGGCELAARLRAWGREPVRLIAVTAYGSAAARRATSAAGFDLHIVIPVDWDELLDVLEALERELGRGGYIGTRRAEFSRAFEHAGPTEPDVTCPVVSFELVGRARRGETDRPA
jgi:CheY-like chemotaxis protein